jgi:hypothetical protein
LKDRIRLVYATVDPLPLQQTATLGDIRTLGRERLGPIFDVAAISVRTIHEAQMEEAALAEQRRLTVRLNGHLAAAGSDLLVGSVSLIELYAFLKAYRSTTGQFDQPRSRCRYGMAAEWTIDGHLDRCRFSHSHAYPAVVAYRRNA